MLDNNTEPADCKYNTSLFYDFHNIPSLCRNLPANYQALEYYRMEIKSIQDSRNKGCIILDKYVKIVTKY